MPVYSIHVCIGHDYSAKVYTDGMLLAGKCAYMDHLRALSSQSPPFPSHLPLSLCAINTPLVVDEWRLQLRDHPDAEFVEYLLRGMTEGFHIGFNYQEYSCRRAKRNMLSAIQNAQVVRDYLKRECELGRVVGPVNIKGTSINVNRFGVIPKPHQPGSGDLLSIYHIQKGLALMMALTQTCAHCLMRPSMMQHQSSFGEEEALY